MINRRKALENISLLLGTTISANLMAGILGEKLNKTTYVPFSENQKALIAEIADVIIPKTTTPGAKMANVQNYIVKVLADCYSKSEQEFFYNNLDRLNVDCKIKFGQEFLTLTLLQKNEMVKNLTFTNLPFFNMIKELTVAGYFTSEIGATQALEYLPVPGKYVGCKPLTSNQKAWAL
jgi:Gluconate 2-dehydrogenase subunit 3